MLARFHRVTAANAGYLSKNRPNVPYVNWAITFGNSVIIVL